MRMTLSDESTAAFGVPAPTGVKDAENWVQFYVKDTLVPRCRNGVTGWVQSCVWGAAALSSWKVVIRQIHSCQSASALISEMDAI